MFESLFQNSEALLQQFYARATVAVIILLIGLIIGKFAGKLLQKILHEIELDSIFKKAGLKLSVETTLSHLTSYFIYFITIIWSLNELGLTTTVLNMISAAALILIIVSILLAVKDIIPNLIGGIIIYQKSMYKENDSVKVHGVEGKIIKITLTETELKTKKGDTIYLPNALAIKTEVLVKKS